MADYIVKPEYPAWACSTCCEKACKISTGKEVLVPRSGICQICGEETALVQTAIYGYPNFAMMGNVKL